MAAQASWTEHQPETGDDELWRVMIAPGEVKVLSLEQVDDLFRLEIIDENTRVWGPQMSGWLPLGVAAGLEAEPQNAAPALAPAPIPSSRPPAFGSAPPPPSRSAPPPPSRSAPPAPRLVSTVPPTPAQVAAAFARPSPSSSSPPPSASSRPPSASSRPPPQPTAAFVAPAGAVVSPSQAALFAPVPSVSVARETFRPMASESDIVFPASRISGGGWLIALAVVLGTGVTLYRNGVVRDVARSSGQEAIYGRLEAAVGGPSFGTPRAVEQLDVTATSAGARAASPSVSSTETSIGAARSAETRPVVARVAAPHTAAGPLPHAVRLEDLSPAKAEGSGASSRTGSKPVSLDALPKPEGAQEQMAQASAVKRRPPAGPSPNTGAVKRRPKDASRMYDPLNPNP